jgi:hypothetical protein
MMRRKSVGPMTIFLSHDSTSRVADGACGKLVTGSVLHGIRTASPKTVHKCLFH